MLKKSEPTELSKIFDFRCNKSKICMLRSVASKSEILTVFENRRFSRVIRLKMILSIYSIKALYFNNFIDNGYNIIVRYIKFLSFPILKNFLKILKNCSLQTLSNTKCLTQQKS